ncbi:MAG: penicillin-binding protein 2 [Planctomycetes bacterium]|nr:penicillin-binding protein 2 [Planctomycetota bacterium]
MNRVPSRRVSMIALICGGVATVGLMVMVARVAQLQLAPPEKLVATAKAQARVSQATQMGLRGDVLDRRGRVLSSTRIGYRVFVDPTLFPEPFEESVQKLAAAAQIEAAKIREPLKVAREKNAPVLVSMKAEEEARKKERRELTPVGLGKMVLAELKGDEVNPGEGQNSESDKPKLDKYVPIGRGGEVLSDAAAEAVRALKMKGVALERHQVREYPGGAEVAPIAGLVDWDNKGVMGAELKLNKDLAGKDGGVKYVRDALGRPLWIESSNVREPDHGDAVRLTIDLEVQRMVTEVLRRGAEECDAQGARCVVVDTQTGEVLALVDVVRPMTGLHDFPYEDKDAPVGPKVEIPERRYRLTQVPPGSESDAFLARNRCVEDVYEPGSTFKPFVWSTITELGLAQPSEVFNTHGGHWITPVGRPIDDVKELNKQTWAEVLINSSNIGMIQAGQRLTYNQMNEMARRFGFGSRTNVGLPGETAGIVTPIQYWTNFSQVSVSYGHEIAVTPVQMARAFAAFCRSGDLAGTIVPLRLTVPELDTTGEPGQSVVTRVLPADVANYTRDVMGLVAENMEAKIKVKPPSNRVGAQKSSEAADVPQWRYSIFGKSGTAKASPLPPFGKRKPKGAPAYFQHQYNSSFIAGGPLENPRIVCIVVVDDPGPKRIATKTHYGSATAGPLVREIMENTLTYLGVPPSPSKVETMRANVPILNARSLAKPSGGGN